MRQQLATASLRLHTILDANWRNYLILPAEVYAGDRPPNAASLRQALGRFDDVARGPQFSVLSQRVEFRVTHQWLQRYAAATGATSTDTALKRAAVGNPAEVKKRTVTRFPARRTARGTHASTARRPLCRR